MILERLIIFGFGRFNDQTYELRSDFQVIFGPNEAGKSTLAHFISAILFGFPTKKSRMPQYPPLKGSQQGGAIEFTQQGHSYRVTRLPGPKGGTVTLVDLATGGSLPAAYLSRLLAPVDAELFQQVYWMTEPALADVFHLKTNPLVERLQHVGAVGSDTWLTAAEAADRRAMSLYKAAGRNPIINQKLREYHDLAERAAGLRQQYPQYLSLLTQQHDLKAQRAQQVVVVTQMRNQLRHTQALVDQWPTFQEWQQLQQSDDDDAQGFTAEDLTILERLTTGLATTQATIQSLADQDQRTAATPTDLYTHYLADKETVDSLLNQWGQQQSAAMRGLQQLDEVAGLRSRTRDLETQLAEGGTMPTRFSTADRRLVADLLSEQANKARERRQLQQTLDQLMSQQSRQQRSTTRRNLGSNQLFWLGLGLVILLGGVFLPSTLLKAIGAILGIGVAYYGVFMVDSETPADRQVRQLDRDIQDVTAQLRELGEASAQLEQQLTQLEHRYHLGNIPVTQWVASQDQIDQWDQALKRIDQLEPQIEAVTQQVTDLTEQAHHVFGSQFLRGGELADQVERWQTLATLIQRENALAASQSATEADHRRALIAAGKQQQTLDAQLTVFLQTRKLQTVEEFYPRYQALRDQDARRKRRDTLAIQLSDTLSELKQVAAIDTLNDTLTKAQTQADLAQRQLDETDRQLATIDGRLTVLGHSGSLASVQQAQANLATQIEQLVSDWLVTSSLRDWITTTLTVASADRLPQILKTASQYFFKLTQKRYTQLINSPGEPLKVMQADGTTLDLKTLSRGTAEQAYLALKVAFAVVMAEQAAMPLMIDDGLVNFDSQRRSAAYALFQSIGQQIQVILLTSDEHVRDSVPAGHIIQLAVEGES